MTRTMEKKTLTQNLTTRTMSSNSLTLPSNQRTSFSRHRPPPFPFRLHVCLALPAATVPRNSEGERPHRGGSSINRVRPVNGFPSRASSISTTTTMMILDPRAGIGGVLLRLQTSHKFFIRLALHLFLLPHLHALTFVSTWFRLAFAHPPTAHYAYTIIMFASLHPVALYSFHEPSFTRTLYTTPHFFTRTTVAVRSINPFS